MWSFRVIFCYVCLVISFPSPSTEEKLRLDEFKKQRFQLVGSKLNLLCATQEGSGPFRFKWTKDGRPVPSTSANHQVRSAEDNSLLIIDSLAPSDAGNYSCTVSNNVGQSDHQTTMLVVKGFCVF